MMIESVSTSAKIPPVSNLLIQQPISGEDLSDQENMKDVAASTDNNRASRVEADKNDGNVDRVAEIVEAVQDSLEMIKEQTTHLRFSVHEQTDQVMVKVTNPDSGEVIREIPSQEFLDLAAKFEKMVGLMFDMKI